MADKRDMPSVRVAIELRRDGSGIAGLLYDERGTAHAFAGWLALLTLLQSACTRMEEAAA